MHNNIELNDKVLSAVAKHVNAKNKTSKADFPVISTGDIVEPKVRGDNIAVLVDGGIKGLAKHTIPYAVLNLRKSRQPRKETAKEISKEEIDE